MKKAPDPRFSEPKKPANSPGERVPFRPDLLRRAQTENENGILYSSEKLLIIYENIRV